MLKNKSLKFNLSPSYLLNSIFYLKYIDTLLDFKKLL